MALHRSYVHGNSVYLEHTGSPGARSKDTVLDTFDGDYGDLIDLGGHGGAACLRLGWGSRFVIFDTGRANNAKSGHFWCHFAIPTPAFEDGFRATARRVLINYESEDIQEISIAAVHVWDGNRRIFADNSPERSRDDYNGGIPRHTTNANARANTNAIWRKDINRSINFGVSVSILIRAQRAKDSFLEIRSVGIDFDMGERR
ncbi:hypothetical protein [Kordia jejudonensis]|uniref:hypothetical protein n=1 Tax=Kordia jejudonensis TaxID=1348245 RepID=UPI0006293AEE|nr:hypothetical protein [Kordia jejudonensis]